MSSSQENYELQVREAGHAESEDSGPNGLRRELYPIHIFAIAISAIIGMGFYVRVGVIESLGGQAAVIYAYGFLGALCLMIMTCLAVMLCIWPIAGALVVFVESFVDPEIGQSVGVLYWLTYCFSFAGLTTAIGQLVSYLEVPNSWSIVISVVSLLLPILFNLTDIRVFRTIEFILASVKLSVVLAIIITMNVINPEVAGSSTTPSTIPSLRPRDIIFQHPGDANWFGVLMASIFLASFSYVGIEVVAATAQEAKGGRNEIVVDTAPWSTRQPTQQTGLVNDSPHTNSTPHRDTQNDTLRGDNYAENMEIEREATNNAGSSTSDLMNQTTNNSGLTQDSSTSSRYLYNDATTSGHNRVNMSTEHGARHSAAAVLIHRPTHHDNNTNGAVQGTSVRRQEAENDTYGQYHMPRKSPFQGLAKYVPIVSAVLYLWGAWSVTQNVPWDDESQPTLANGTVDGWSNSIFINSAKKSNRSGLDRGLAGVLILNIASTSSTALYVASRTLFGLTFTISTEMDEHSQGWRKIWLYLMRFLSRKSKFDVPYVAVLASAWGLILPFLKYVHGNSYLTAIDVVTEMGSVSCILVWGWESFAAYRFFKCSRLHRGEDFAPATTDKNVMDIEDDVWYYFHLAIAIFASIMCPIIVFVGGAFTVVHNKNATQGVATFLVVAIFLGLTLLLKLIRWGRDGGSLWDRARLVPLDDVTIVTDIIDRLDNLKRKHIDIASTRAARSWSDFGGIIDSDWILKKLGLR